MVNGTPGWKGYYLSAYGLAVKRGYPGTEEEWLDSLHGADVEMRYENGELQWKHDTSEEWHTLEEFTVLQELLEQRSERAQAAAELAEEKAQTAGTAATAANTAAGAANSAAAAANTATSTVSKAKEEAEAAAAAAETAAEEANTAAEAATVKAQAAELAASGANAATGAAQAAKEAANTAAELANSKASAAETAAGQANAAAGAAQEAKTAANTAATAANTAAETAQTQGNYAKTQGDRAAQLVDEIENTDVGGMAADILALQSGKADLVNGKVPGAQLPELNFDPAGSAAAVQALLSAHTGNKANPHGVTAAQIGVTAKRTCTFVVGTSTAGWTAADCDYLCDGVDDQVEIQAALNALPDTGGEVLLLSGVYSVNAAIQLSKSFTSLSGSQCTATIRQNADFEYLVSTEALANNCKISDLILDGNDFEKTAILLGGTGKSHIVNNNIVKKTRTGITAYGTKHRVVKNDISCNYSGIACYASKSDFCENSVVNPSSPSGGGAIIISSSECVENRIFNNVCENFSIGIRGNGSRNNICNNRCIGCGRGLSLSDIGSVVSDNLIYNSQTGIYMSSCKKSKVSGNSIINFSGEGIDMYLSSDNTIIGNSIFLSTNSSIEYTDSQYSIRVRGYESEQSNNNLVVCNNIPGKNYSNESGSTNTFADNKYN